MSQKKFFGAKFGGNSWFEKNLKNETNLKDFAAQNFLFKCKKSFWMVFEENAGMPKIEPRWKKLDYFEPKKSSSFLFWAMETFGMIRDSCWSDWLGLSLIVIDGGAA